MGARHFKELIVWQLAEKLRDEVCRLTAQGEAARHFTFVDEIRDAASDVPSDIAEGFRRQAPRDFARFLNYAFSGVAEVTVRLEDGVARKYWTEDDLVDGRLLIRRLDKAATRLLHYLRSEAAQENARRGRRTSDDRILEARTSAARRRRRARTRRTTRAERT